MIITIFIIVVVIIIVDIGSKDYLKALREMKTSTFPKHLKVKCVVPYIKCNLNFTTELSCTLT